ncbi:MAG: hypothetical protein SFW36_04725 [Leptolyngbyaceae cyanobacterium bins.59]|nr:hypothetical protein [Leptolyngbyaceae cyanobacterium bins.59]
MTQQESWFIVKTATGHCEVVPANQLPTPLDPQGPEQLDRWGPFESESEALARRIGLIRAGKCQPN